LCNFLINSYSPLIRLVGVGSLVPATDRSPTGVVPLSKFGLRDATFVRNCCWQPLCRPASLDIVENASKFFDEDTVNMIQ
jgi:hypothetical protein